MAQATHQLRLSNPTKKKKKVKKVCLVMSNGVGTGPDSNFVNKKPTS
jgi:hypothetical protein